MRRTGTVSAINARRGMIAIATEDDGFTIIELTSDWDIEVGDVIAWTNGYGLGSEVYENITKKTQSDVFVQNHAVSKSNLHQQLLM